MDGFIEYLSGRIEEGKTEIARLEADNRMDDAAFAKVRTNIYDVCKTVTLALVDRPGFGISAVQARFEGFKASWGTALEEAREHDDAKAIAVEETKLSALADVTDHFQEVR